MSNISIGNNRQWYDIVQDGNGGESNRIQGSIIPFVSVNTSIDGNSRVVLSVFYYDTFSKCIRRSFDRSPDMEFETLSNVSSLSGVTNVIGYTDQTNYSNSHYYYTDENSLYSSGASIPLTDFSSNPTNVKIKKYISSTNNYFVLSVSSNIYSITGDSVISYTQLVNDYDGRDFYPYIDDATQTTYLAYTNSSSVQVLTPETSITVTTYGTIVYTSAKLGNSAIFNNTVEATASNYILAGITQTNPISISIWFNTTNATSLQSVFSLVDENLNPILDFQFYNPNVSNGVVLNITGSSGYVNIPVPGTQVAANTWYHLCVTIDSSYYSILYVNGVNVGSVMSSSLGNVDYIMMGGNGTGTSSFVGYIDELNIFNRAISSADVTTLYGLGTISSGLIAHFAFDAPIANLYPLTVTSTKGFLNLKSNNIFVGVGTQSGRGQIAYSNNGNNWNISANGSTLFSQQVICVATNGTTWIAGGTGTNKMAYSIDGNNWIPITSGNSIFANGGVQSIAYNNNQWVAGGYGTNRIAYSSNGINWTIATSSNSFSTTNCFGFTYYNNNWYAICDTKLLVSSDGITWTLSINLSSFISANCFAISSNNSRIIIGGQGTNTLIYSDSSVSNWNASTSGNNLFNQTCNAIKWNGSLFVACGAGNESDTTIAYSSDGISWTAAANNLFGFGQTGRTIAWNGSVWTAGSDGTNFVAYSSNAINWTASTSGNSIFNLCSGMVSGNSYITNIPVTSSVKNNSGIFNNVSGTLISVAGGSGANRLAYTNDGINWYPSSNGNLIFTNNCSSVVYNGTMWVAGGSGTNSLAYSYDGINWSASINGNSVIDFVQSIAWDNNGMWMAIGQDKLVSSTDGINWNSVTSILNNGFEIANNGSIWVAAGYNGTQLAYSTDGQNWTPSTSGCSILSNGCSALAWNGSLWVAGGSIDNVIAYSSDGINWNASASAKSLFRTQCVGVAWNGSKWVAGGNSYESSPQNSLIYSSDGINWTASANGNAIFLQGSKIAWTGSLWLACGSGNGNMIAYSSDGINWTASTSGNNIFSGGSCNRFSSYIPSGAGIIASTNYLTISNRINFPISTAFWFYPLETLQKHTILSLGNKENTNNSLEINLESGSLSMNVEGNIVTSNVSIIPNNWYSVFGELNSVTITINNTALIQLILNGSATNVGSTNTTITTNGTPTFTIVGGLQSAVFLDTSTPCNYTMPISISTGGFSVSVWVFIPSSAPYFYSVGVLALLNNSTVITEIFIFYDNNSLNLYYNGNFVNTTSNSNITKSSWFNVIITYNGSDFNVYIDSILTDTYNSIGNPNITSMIVGGSNAVTGPTKTEDNFYLRQACLFNYVLTSEEISNIYVNTQTENSLGNVNVISQAGLYVNGQSNTIPITSNVLNYTDQFIVGCNNNGLTNGFNGYLDEFYVFNNFNPINPNIFNSNITIADNTGQTLYIPFDTPVAITYINSINYNVVGNVGVNVSSAVIGNSAYFNNIVTIDGNTSPTIYNVVPFTQPPPFTISFWFNCKNVTLYNTVFSLGNGYILNYDIYNSIISLNGISSSPISISSNTWYHIVLTLDSSFNFQIYLNNTLQQSGSASTNITSYTQIILASSGGLERGYNGYMDELIVYNRVISSTEVSSLYNIKGSTSVNSNSVVPESAIIYMPLDGNNITSEFCVACGLYTQKSIKYTYDGINWFDSNNPFNSGQAFGVAYNGKMWIAVGQGTDNTIAYSLDGIYWIGVGIIIKLAGQTIAWNGNYGPIGGDGMWIAGGNAELGGTNFAYSYNGINWTPLLSELFVNAVIKTVACNGSLWLAGGTSAIGSALLMSSSDGLNWTNIDVSSRMTTSVNTIAWNGSIWLVGGIGSSTIIYSSDGITWNPAANNLIENAVYGFAWNGLQWVGVGNGSVRAAHSTDGVTWTGSSEQFTGKGYPFSITWNGNMFVAVTNIGYSVYSIDGITWSNGNMIPFTDNNALYIASSYVLPYINTRTPNTLNITNGITYGSVIYSGVNGGSGLFVNPVGDVLVPNDYITVSNTQNLPITVSFWFNSNDSTNIQSILSFTTSSFSASNAGFTIDFIPSTNNLTFAMALSSTWTWSAAIYTSNNSVLPNIWNHVAFTVDTSFVLTGYINGINCGVATGTAPFFVNSLFMLGGYAGQRAFNGYMGEFMVYNNVLNASQIFDLYKLKTNLNGRIIYLPLNQPLSNTPIIPVESATTVGTISYTVALERNSGFFNNTIGTSDIPPTNYMLVPYTKSVPISISFWFNFTNVTSGTIGSIIGLTNSSIGSAGGNIINFNILNSTIQCNINTVGNLSVNSYGIISNTWYHVCLTIDASNNQKFYINNNLIGSGIGSGILNNYTQFIIGGSGDLLKALNGYVDDFAVYNRILSPIEINNLYNLKNVTNGQIIYLPFDAPIIVPTVPTIIGSVNYTTSVKGNSAFFNNTTGVAPSNYLIIPYTNSFPITISFWINCSDVTTWQTPVGLTDDTNSYIMNFDITTGNISMHIVTGGITGTSTPIEINKWYHICATIDSLDNQCFYVGGSLIGSSVGSLPIPSYTKFRIGGDSENTRSFNGYVDEFIIYNRVLSASEVTSLANAKNVTDSVVAYVPLDKEPWSVTQIRGCQLWLDSADPLATGTAPANGTNISSWKDKSGNGLNGTATGTGSATLVNSANGIVFNGTGYYDTPYLSNPTIETVFIVLQFNNLTGQQDIIGTNIIETRDLYMYGGVVNFNSLGTGTNIFVGTNPISSNTRILYDYTYNNTNTKSYFNGSQDGTANNSNFSGTGITQIGGTLDIGTFNGIISEIIIYNTFLSVGERQQIEGYLAKKWELQSSLPTYHPYYLANTVTATGNPWLPTNLSSLQLWLDGADPLGTGIPVASGTVIDTWIDKSSNGYDATGTANATINAQNAITFNGTSQYYSSNYSSSNAEESIFIVYSINTLSTYGLIDTTTIGGRSFDIQNITYDTYNPSTTYSPGAIVTANNTVYKLRSSVVAGSGNSATTDGTGIGASFTSPYAIAVDGNNNLYVCDQTANCIRKITSAGVVTTLAGSGVAGYTDGTGLEATFTNPNTIGVSKVTGNIFVSDRGSLKTVRWISPAGVVSTLISVNDPQDIWGFAVDLNENVFYLNVNGGSGGTTQLCKLVYNGNNSWSNTVVIDAGQLSYAKGICMGLDNNLYVSDTNNGRVVRVDQSSYALTTVYSGINYYNIAVDSFGYLYTPTNNQIIKNTNIVVAGSSTGASGFADGQLADLIFDNVTGMCIGIDGSVFVTDYNNYKVRKFRINNLDAMVNIGFDIYNAISGPALTLNNSGGSNYAILPLSISNDVSYLSEITYSNAGVNIFMNGNRNLTNTNNATFSTGTTVIGAGLSSGSIGNFLAGTISEIIICNTVLNETDRQYVEGYLAWKWGLKSSLPISNPFKFYSPVYIAPVTNGTNIFVAGGTNIEGGASGLYHSLAYSNDAITWTSISYGDTPYSTYNIIAYGNGLWLAGGSFLIYSTDAINWSLSGIPSGNINGIVWAANISMWIVSVAGVLYNSIDGLRWNLYYNSKTINNLYYVNNKIYGIANGNGDNNTLYSSTNGLTWTTTGLDYIQSIAYNGSQYLAGCSSATSEYPIYYSSDGVSWTGSASSQTIFEGMYVAQYGPNIILFQFAWNGTNWVAASQSTTIVAYSSDGITWTNAGCNGYANTASGVAWNGTNFVAVLTQAQVGGSTNPTNVLYSSDGITWTVSTSGSATLNDRAHCIAVGNSITNYNTNIYIPTQISGLFNWIDTSDITTLYTDSARTIPVQNSGDSVAYIADKTGFASVSTNGTAPIYKSKLLNLNPGVDFSNGSGLTSSLILKSSNVTLFWVGTVSSNIPLYGPLWGHYSTDGLKVNTDILLRRNVDGQMSWFTNSDNSIAIDLNPNQPVIYYATMGSGVSMNFTMITNGGIYTNTSKTVTLSWTTGLAPIFIGADSFGNASTSFMSEILYYQRVLTQTEINTIINYLSTKWSIKTIVPSAPIENTVNTWLPNKESKLGLWLDAADYSTSNITNMTNVTVFNDKVGGIAFYPQGTYLSNLTLTTGNINPYIASMNFNNNSGNNVYMTGNYGLSNVGSALFIVNPFATTNTNESIINWNGELSVGFKNNNNTLSVYSNISGSIDNTPKSNITIDSPIIVYSDWNLSGGNADVSLSVNGNSLITGSLLSNPFNPSSVAGLQLWLDGSDSATITQNGANIVTQWSDKSGNNRNATGHDNLTYSNNKLTFEDKIGINAFIVKSAYNNIMNYSIDGINWQFLTDASSISLISSFAYGNNLWVTTQNSSLAYSYDCITWNTINFYSLFFSQPKVVVFSNNVFMVGCSGSGSIFRSTDGINWTQVAASNEFSNSVYALAYGGGLWVSGGYGLGGAPNAFGWSDDNGLTWHDSVSGNNIFAVYCANIAYGNGVFVAASGVTTGYDMKIGYSTDGKNWNLSNVSFGYAFCNTISFNDSVFVCGGQLSILGNFNVIIYSSNGINWTGTEGSNNIFNNVRSIIYNGSILVAVGAGPGGIGSAIAYSSDGITWTASNGSGLYNNAIDDVSYGYLSSKTFPGGYFSTNYTSQPTTETAFIVANFSNVTARQDLISTSTNLGREFTLNSGNIELNAIGSAYIVQNGITPVLNTTYLLEYDYSTSNANLYANGSISNSASGSFSFGGSGTTNIGAFSTGDQNFNGNISEVIIYNSVLSISDRQKVEGYLAWKWGLNTSLPNNHPYYASVPINPFTFSSQSTLTIGSGDNNYSMNLGEVLVYSEIISSDARQKAEGYLANKWGLQSSLPNTHPFVNVAPTITNIIYPIVVNGPSSFNGLIVWLDGSDPYGTGNGNVPPIGTPINKWYDKSGNNNHFIQTVVDRIPIYNYDSTYNKNGLLFNGNQYYIPEGNSFIYGLNKYTIFTVHKFNNSGSNTVYVSNNSINWLWFRYSGLIGFAFGGVTAEATSPISYSSACGISCLKRDSTSNGYLNGQKIVSSIYSGLATEPDGPFIIGNDIVGYPNGSLNGSIFEVLVFNYAMNDTERQVVESYLANKWGLGQKLPADHQYNIVSNSNVSKSGNVIYSGGYEEAGNSTIITNTNGSFSSNYITIPNTKNIPLSINFWMNCNNVIPYQTVVGLSDASFNTSGLNIDIIGGKLIANICLANISYPNIITSIISNKWFNIGLNIDNNYNGTLYLNGTNVGYANGGGGNISNIVNYTQFILGGPSDNSARSYSGYIEDFNVYNRILSDNEMKNLYYNGSNSVINGLIIQQPLSANVNISNITTTGNIIISGVNGNGGSAFFNNSISGVSTNYLTVEDSTNIPLSLSFWFNILNYDPASGTILYKNNGIAIKIYQTNLQILCAIPTPWTTIQLLIPTVNLWHHLCVTIDSSFILNAYIDGIKVGGATGTGNLPNSTLVSIGGIEGDVGFNGYMENLLIYNRSLSASEVSSLYNLQSITNGLTVNLPLTADPNSITNDISNAITIGNVQIVPGIYGKCSFFNNTLGAISSQYVTVPNLQNLPITFSFWMNSTSITSDVQNPFSIGGTEFTNIGNVGSIRCDLSDGTIKIYISVEDTTFITYAITANTWYHICVTIDSTYTGILYVNGVNVGSNQSSRTSIANYTQINIATSPDNNPFAYNGYIEEVKIYNRVLLSNEVLSLYQSNNISYGLITYLPLDAPSIIISETGIIPINSPFPAQYKGIWSNGTSYTLNDVVLLSNVYWCLVETGGWTIGGAPPSYGWAEITNMSGSTIFNNPTSSAPANTILSSYNITGAISIAFWVYCFDVTQSQTPVGLTDDLNTFIVNFDIGNPSGTIGFHTSISGGVNNNNATILSNKWYHVCGTIDGTSNEQKFYVNGLEYAVASGSALSAYTQFRLGGSSDNIKGFQGYLQNFVVYNRVLAYNEVASLYNMYTPTSGLQINLPLNQSAYGIINTNSETISGNPTYTTGQIGNAVNFTDGISYITVPNSTNVPISISFWFNDTGYASAGTTGNCILSGDAYNDGFLIFLYGDNIKIYIAMPSLWTIFFDIPYTTGSWNHAAITIDSSFNVTLYINGVNVGTQTGSSNITHLTTFSFGSANTYSSYGSIDDFQVYNRSLKIFEVTNIYNTGLYGKSLTLNGLVTYLPFENGSDIQQTIGNVVYSGVNGGSAFFNNPSSGAATDYLTITNSTNVPISVAFWFCATEDGSRSQEVILLSGNNSTGGIIISLFETGYLNIQFALPNLVLMNGPQINFYTWNHICVTIDSSVGFTVSVYVNGVFVNSDSSGSAPLTNFNTIYLGGDTNGSIAGFMGYIEDFMVYNRVLSGEEVTTLYNVGTITSGRVIYLHLDNGDFGSSGGGGSSGPTPNYWVAVGADNTFTTSIAISSDGMNWTPSTENPFTGSAAQDIKWNGSYWLAVGGNIAKSYDAMTWTTIQENPFNSAYVIGIAWNGSYWIAVGYNPDNSVCIAKSSDGMNWSPSVNNPFSGSNGSKVAWNGSYWIAVGGSADPSIGIAISSDGMNWTLPTNNPFSGGSCKDIAWNDSYWVAVGLNGDGSVCIATSSDGINWVASTDNPFIIGNGIAWNGSYWVAGGNNSDNTVCIATSSDGMTWTPSTDNPFLRGTCNRVAWNNSYWIAVGNNLGEDFSPATVTIAKSSDGMTWVPSTNNPFTSYQGLGIAYGGSISPNINPYNMSVLATLTSTQHSKPRIIMYNGTLYLFVVNSLDNFIYSTVIDGGKNASILNKFKEATDFIISIISGKMVITAVNPTGRLNRMTVANNELQNYYFIKTNVNVRVFDMTNLNDEEYIFYIGTDNLMHQVWNPALFIDVKSEHLITNLLIRNNDENIEMVPTFSQTIKDYYISSSAVNELVEVRFGLVTILDGNTNTYYYKMYPGQCLHIYDYLNHYYVKLLPNNTTYGSNITKNTGYIPGYYLSADTYGNSSQYYTIHDSNGVPVWYRRNTSDPNYINNPQVCSLFLGMGKNRVVTNIFDVSRTRTIIDISNLNEENYKAITPDTRGLTIDWDVHEALEIKNPLNRRGNMLFGCYTSTGGFYFQEQNKNHQIVWEYWSTDLIYDQPGDYFHFNSLDVHPITGDIVCSFRNCSTVACFNYRTKNIDWAIDPTGAFAASAINSSLIKFLTCTNEPSGYNGTINQHDARWHYDIAPLTYGNNIISVFDNQSATGIAARGVIYEIDLINSNAINRGNIVAPSGASSGYMGSYKIQRELNGTYSHVVDYVQHHPNLYEFADDGTGMPTGSILFSMDFPGDLYRISKARPVDLDIIAMRKTSGMPISTLLIADQLWNTAGSTNVTVNSISSVTKTSANDSWDSQIYSNTSYIKPFFSIQLSSITGGTLGVFGLSENPAASIGFENVNYGWYFDLAIPNASIYELGILISTPVATITKVNSIYEINFDGTNINYLVDGVNVRSVARTSQYALYCNLCISKPSVTLSNIYYNTYANA